MSFRDVVRVVFIVAATAAILIGYSLAERVRRRGGDRTAVVMDVALVDQESFAAMAMGLGEGDVRLPDGGQAVVVRISWEGPAFDGWYQLALLDARNLPARPLAALGGWDTDGIAVAHTSSAYDMLSVAYEWMEGAATVRDGLGGATRLSTVGTRARSGGGLVGVFLAGLSEPKFTDAGQLIGGLILTGPDDSVAWAKQITPVTWADAK